MSTDSPDISKKLEARNNCQEAMREVRSALDESFVEYQAELLKEINKEIECLSLRVGFVP